MNKRGMFFILGCVGLSGFALIVLQYKVTQLSMQVPAVEENYLRLKEESETLELHVRALKNPKRLLEEKEKNALGTYHFPQSSQVFAVHIQKYPQEAIIEAYKPSGLNLPIAKVFP